MPSKGDDLDALSSRAAIEHLSNVTAFYTAKGEPKRSSKTVPIRGKFERQFVEVAGQEGYSPTFECHIDDIPVQPGLAQDDQLAVNDIDYIVKSTEPDGFGLVLLILRLDHT